MEIKDSWVFTVNRSVSNSTEARIFGIVIYRACCDARYVADLDLGEWLPSVEELLRSDLLQDLCSSSDFQYLIRGLYERIQRMTAAAGSQQDMQ